MHQSMQRQPCYRSAGQMADQSRQGMSQTIGGVRTPHHLMGLTPNPSIYGIQNMYPHQGAATYRHGQPHQIITLVNPQGPYQYSGCNVLVHPPDPPSPYYMPSPPSSYPPIAFGHQPFMPGPTAPAPGYYRPEMVETPMPMFNQSCGMKREKKIIKIINPKTGVDVIDELAGHASPVVTTTVAVSTETEYQPSSGTYVIAAQFAAQVAATLTLPMGSKDPRAVTSYYGAEVQRGSTCGQEYARPLETRIFQPVGNVLSPEAEKLSSAMKVRSRKKSKDVQKSTVDGGKLSNLETTKVVMGSTYPEKLPDVKISDGVVGDSLESRSLLLSGSQTEQHLVASLTLNASSATGESCEGYSAMSGDGFGTMSATSFNTTLGQDSTDRVLTCGAVCGDDTVCSTAAVDTDALLSNSCANGAKTYLETNEKPANLVTAAEDFVELEPQKITLLLRSAPTVSPSELCHQHQDSISPAPSSFPEPHDEPPCSSPNARLIPDLFPHPTSFPEHPREPPPSSPNAHLNSELFPSVVSLPEELHDPRVLSLAPHLTDDEQSATDDAGDDAFEEQTDELPSEPPQVVGLDRPIDVQTEMLEAPAPDEDLASETLPSDAFHVEVLNLPDLMVVGDETAISTTLFESPAELDDGFQADLSFNETDSPSATCHLPDHVTTNSTLEVLPELDTCVHNHTTTDDSSVMALPPVAMETDSETYKLSSPVSMVTTNSNPIGSRPSRLSSGGQDRRLGRITILECGQTLKSHQAGLNNAYGQHSRVPATNGLVLLLTDEPTGFKRQCGGDGGGDGGGGGGGRMSGRSFSPSNSSNVGVGRSDGSTERLRNRTNLQLNIRSKMEDRDSIAEEPQLRVKSPTPRDVQLTRVAESRTKEQRTDGQGHIQYDKNLLQLQIEPESLQQSASLPCLPEIVLDNPNVRSSNERQIIHQAPPLPRKSFVDFTPPYAHQMPGLVMRIPGNSTAPPPPRMAPVVTSGPSRAPQQRRPIHQKEQPPPRKVIQVSLQLNVQLHTAENAWKPGHKKDVPPETDLLNENGWVPRPGGRRKFATWKRRSSGGGSRAPSLLRFLLAVFFLCVAPVVSGEETSSDQIRQGFCVSARFILHFKFVWAVSVALLVGYPLLLIFLGYGKKGVRFASVASLLDKLANRKRLQWLKRVQAWLKSVGVNGANDALLIFVVAWGGFFVGLFAFIFSYFMC